MHGVQEQGQRTEQVMRTEMAAAAADLAAVQDRCAHATSVYGRLSAVCVAL